MPAIVDTVLQRGEFLTAYTPYQPEMSQGILQAIFEYQTAICELTGMDVSNASGYDGVTVAAEPASSRSTHRAHADRARRDAQPAGARGREDLRARASGSKSSRSRHEGGVTDPGAHRRRGEGAAAVIFPQPNFFGCLEDAPALAAAAREAGALAVAHVDLTSLGVLEAPARTAATWRSARGRAIGNAQSYGGPHYGFLASRTEFIRRLPGRIVGQTTDLNGERGFVLTLQTREQHIRREKATSNMTTNQTLLALGGLVTLAWLGPQGLRELGETCMALAAYARERIALPAAFDRPVFKELALRTPRPAREVIREARALGVHPGYALGRDYEGMDDVLLVALTEKRTPADVDRLADVLAEVCG